MLLSLISNYFTMMVVQVVEIDISWSRFQMCSNSIKHNAKLHVADGFVTKSNTMNFAENVDSCNNSYCHKFELIFQNFCINFLLWVPAYRFKLISCKNSFIDKKYLCIFLDQVGNSWQYFMLLIHDRSHLFVRMIQLHFHLS